MDTRLLTFLLTWVMIIILVLFAIYVASTLNLPKNTSKSVPLSCGLTEKNHSESYTIHMTCGRSQCPTTYYYQDLVCTNGTTILKYTDGR